MTENAHRSVIEPWAIYQWISPTYSKCLGKYRNRADAEGHLRLLRQQCPGRYKVVFDVPAQARKGD